MPKYRSFHSDNGTSWRVEILLPGSSSALIRFGHPRTPLEDRYGWFQAQSAEARSVTSHLDKKRVLEGLTDADLARAFRRSMRVDAEENPLNRPNASFPGGFDVRLNKTASRE